MKTQLRRCIAFLFVSIVVATASASAGTAVTPFNHTFCASTYPSGFVTGTIKISASTAGAFNALQTNRRMDLVLPANFAYNTAAGATVTFAVNQGITAASAVVLNSRRIRLTMSTGVATNKFDTITITFQVRALTAPVTSTTSVITRSDSTDIGNVNRFRIDKRTNRPAGSLGLLNSAFMVAYSSGAVTQASTATVYSGTGDNQILQIAVTVTGTCNTTSVTQLAFNTIGGNGTGTDNPAANLAAAKVYYTGASNAFSTATLFGTAASPNGAFTVSGSQVLTTAGTYYFWLTYDLTPMAVSGNKVDAQVTGITVGGTLRTDMSTPAPTGSRTVSTLVYYSLATGNWSTATLWSYTSGGATCNCVPNGSGYVIIDAGHTVTVNNNYAADVVEVRAGATLKDNATGILTVNHALKTLGTGLFTASTSWVINTLNTTGSGSSSFSKPVTVSGDVVIGSGTQLSLLGTGDLTLQKNLTAHGTVNVGLRTLLLSGTAAVITGTGTITGTTGAVSITNDKYIPVDAALTVVPSVNIGTNATVQNHGLLTLQNNLTGSNVGSTLVNNAGATLAVAGALLTTGTLTATAFNNLVSYNGNAAQNVKGTGYYNVRFGGTAASVKTLAGAITVQNNLTVADAATLNAGTGSITLTGNWIATTSATPFVPNSTTITFNGISAITGYTTTFHNVSISGILLAHPVNTNVKGSFTNSGTFEHNEGTVTFTGTTALLGTSATNFQHVVVTAGSALTAHSTDTYIEGNLTVNGTFNHNNGTVYLFGASAQQISSASTLVFSKLVVDNSNATGITLFTPVTVNSTLTMTNGYVVSSALNPVRLAAGATATASGSSFVRGRVVAAVAASGTTAVFFPVGKATDYRPITLTVTHSNNTSVDYSAEMKNNSAQNFGYTLPPTITHVSPARYYIVDRQAVPNFTSATIKLTYGPDDGVSDPANLRIVKNIGTGTQWFDVGGMGTAAIAGTITSSPFTTFSIFTLGNATGGNNVLPVQLTAFDATPNRGQVDLYWETESEENSARFEVERSADGAVFTTITTVAAAGTSFLPLAYTAVDAQPLPGTSYYRLRMVDHDGTYSFSQIRAVTFNTAATFRVYPNPVTTGALYVTGVGERPSGYALYRCSGGLVKEGPMSGNGPFVIDLRNVPSGYYLLVVDGSLNTGVPIVVSH